MTRIQETAERLGSEKFYDDYLARGTVQEPHLLVALHQVEAMQLKYASKGVGDQVARIAKPIARALKAASAGVVDLTNCGRCKSNQNGLNGAFPTKPAK